LVLPHWSHFLPTLYPINLCQSTPWPPTTKARHRPGGHLTAWSGGGGGKGGNQVYFQTAAEVCWQYKARKSFARTEVIETLSYLCSLQQAYYKPDVNMRT
jgi:hypothetical protein